MNTYADKSREDTSRAVANNLPKHLTPTVQLAEKPNYTGLPNQLKTGIESLSGMSMDHVKVHYNSDKPAQLNAHAYAQGSEIHVASGEERHLPHEAWHVVQQAQGRVKPTMQLHAIYQQKLRAPIANNSPVQLNKEGRWWGSAIGGVLGGAVGAAAGYTYGAVSATTSAITGGISGAVTGYQTGGITGALTWGGIGAATNLAFGLTSGTLVGASAGMKLGSALGSGVGDWWTGEDRKAERDKIAENMKIHVVELLEASELQRDLQRHQGVQKVRGKLTENEIKLLNWMYKALGAANFDEVARGGQVRVKFDEDVFQALIKLEAQKRQSSHYSGLLFTSGFSQVVGEQYGTKGAYLPTVLFGKIVDRDGNAFMYFQPEGHAFNPDTGLQEKLHHVQDAYKYAFKGVQQGPHGESVHTDALPITSSGKKYQPTLSDKIGPARYGDFEAFAANLLYTSGGSRLLPGKGETSNEFKVAAMHLLVTLGLNGLAYLAWKRFNG